MLLPQWGKVGNNLSPFFQIDSEVLHIMQKSSYRKNFRYKSDVTDLLRFIRNLDEHPNER